MITPGCDAWNSTRQNPTIPGSMQFNERNTRSTLAEGRPLRTDVNGETGHDRCAQYHGHDLPGGMDGIEARHDHSDAPKNVKDEKGIASAAARFFMNRVSSPAQA